MCSRPQAICLNSVDKDGRSVASSEASEERRRPELERAIRNGTYYSEDTPSRPVYLAARCTSVCLGVLLVILAVVATAALDRPAWLAPVLSPAINALVISAVNVTLIVCRDRRYWRLHRLLYDGALGVGCAVAGGFLVSFTLGDIRGTREGASAGTKAVAWLILFSMFAEM